MYSTYLFRQRFCSRLTALWRYINFVLSLLLLLLLIMLIYEDAKEVSFNSVHIVEKPTVTSCILPIIILLFFDTVPVRQHLLPYLYNFLMTNYHNQNFIILLKAYCMQVQYIIQKLSHLHVIRIRPENWQTLVQHLVHSVSRQKK